MSSNIHPIFQSISNRRILVSPLDWGLGHAARIAGVVRNLMERNEVTVMCGPSALAFMRQEIPGADILPIHDWRIRYPKGKIGLLTILGWVPVVIRNSIHEHFVVRRLLRARNIDLVISDNRYGLKFRNIECMIVTHQVYPKMPRGLGWIENVNGWLFKKFLSIFNKVLIPDMEQGFSLSGMLSADRPLNPEKFVRVGILSRFCQLADSPKNNRGYRYDVMALISGQEDQRTVFENMLIDALGRCGKRVLMVRGVSADRALPPPAPCIEYRNMLSGDGLLNAINDSAVVICRAGYSTLCDVVALGKRAVIVPTPGQTEQEYLADRLNGNMGFSGLRQDGPDFGTRLLELIGSCVS